MVGVTKNLAYIWQDRWNGEGFKCLVPRFGCGRPPLQDDEKKLRLSILVSRDDWSTMEVGVLIMEKSGIEYSMKHVRKTLRDMGIKFGKPYPHNYRRKKKAEGDLKN